MSKKKSSRHGDETGRSARHRVSKLASAIAKRELAKARTLLASLVAEPAAAESLRSQLRAKPHRGIAEGDTLLHLAVKSGDAGLVRLLTEHGADVNAADARGRLPGHVAGPAGARALLEAAAAANVLLDRERCDDSGCSACAARLNRRLQRRWAAALTADAECRSGGRRAVPGAARGRGARGGRGRGELPSLTPPLRVIPAEPLLCRMSWL